MKRRTNRAQERAKLKAQKQAGMKRPGHKSKYARKSAWLHAHAAWGFDVPEPKPWRSS
jgi:hypothetical protein